MTVLGGLQALGCGVDGRRLELLVERKLLHQGGAQFGVVVDDENFSGIGHNVGPGERRHARSRAFGVKEQAVVQNSRGFSMVPGRGDDEIRRTSFAVLRVRTAAGTRTRGWLTAGPLRVPVALGRGGIKANKREGDGATPAGRFRLKRLWWRADRGPRPKTLLPVRRIRPATTPGSRTRPTGITTGRSGSGPAPLATACGVMTTSTTSSSRSTTTPGRASPAAAARYSSMLRDRD